VCFLRSVSAKRNNTSSSKSCNSQNLMGSFKPNSQQKTQLNCYFPLCTGFSMVVVVVILWLLTSSHRRICSLTIRDFCTKRKCTLLCDPPLSITIRPYVRLSVPCPDKWKTLQRSKLEESLPTSRVALQVEQFWQRAAFRVGMDRTSCL